jgi:hypothetical protein
MTNRYLREIDLMRRGTGEGALDLDMINRDGFDAMQDSEAIAEAAGGLGRLVAEYSQEGCGIAIIDKGDDVSIIGVYHAKDIAALPAALQTEGGACMDAPEIVYVDFDGFGTPESIWLGGYVSGSVIYIRKNLHDAALALIAKLEAEHDAAHAEGYRAGVEAAAAKCEYGRKNYQILNKDKITPAPFTTQKAARTMAALLEEDIRALLNSEADT